MANDVVRLANQFVFRESADIKEILIDIGNLPFQISLGNDQTVSSQHDFVLSHRLVIAHGSTLRSDALKLCPIAVALGQKGNLPRNDFIR